MRSRSGARSTRFRARAIAIAAWPDPHSDRRRPATPRPAARRVPLGAWLAALLFVAALLAQAARAGEPSRAGAATAAQVAAIPHDVITLGRSVEGRPIQMHIFGDGPDRVLILAGTHGDEPAGPAVAWRLIHTLGRDPQLTGGRTIAVIPAVNPDGLHRLTRTNARGVDLNRNYPASDWRPAEPGALSHGVAPCSEPETAAVARAVVLIAPSRIVDIHSIDGGRQCNNYDGPGRSLAALMSAANGYVVAPQIGYPTPGCLGSWTGIDDGIPTITLELPRGLAPARCWRENETALAAFVTSRPPARVATTGAKRGPRLASATDAQGGR